jgi:hypothetical protein
MDAPLATHFEIMTNLRGYLHSVLLGVLAAGCTFDASHVGAEAAETDRERVLTFADLALSDETADFLLDALFEGVAVSEGEFELPEPVRGLEGQRVTIEGYMIPSKWTGTQLREFLLVRDQSACCVGSVPRPGHWVQVRVSKDEGQEFMPYVPVRAHGVLGLNRTMPEGGFVTCTYTLECDSVERAVEYGARTIPPRLGLRQP